MSVSKHAHVCFSEGLDSVPIPRDVHLRCDAEWSGAVGPGKVGRCRKPATTGVRYAWGAAVYCDKHAAEETRR
jgi:hypothetical protein